jgi:hypothetical protein
MLEIEAKGITHSVPALLGHSQEVDMEVVALASCTFKEEVKKDVGLLGMRDPKGSSNRAYTGMRAGRAKPTNLRHAGESRIPFRRYGFLFETR